MSAWLQQVPSLNSWRIAIQQGDAADGAIAAVAAGEHS